MKISLLLHEVFRHQVDTPLLVSADITEEVKNADSLILNVKNAVLEWSKNIGRNPLDHFCFYDLVSYDQKLRDLLSKYGVQNLEVTPLDLTNNIRSLTNLLL